MDNVGNVIFDALAGRRRVVLPGVGSLEVRRRKAKKISETQIIPPQNVVTFTPDELDGAVSAVDLLAAGGIPYGEALSLYEQWLDGARTADGLVIEGVGEIREGRFAASTELHEALNPAGEEEIVVIETERRRASVWPWVLVGILAAALAFLAVWFWNRGAFDVGKDRVPEAVEIAPSPASGTAGEEGANPSGEITDTPGASPTTAAPAPAVVPAAARRFHVIAGSFSVAANADDLVAKIRRDHPELTVEKVVNRSNGNTMVSIFSSTSETQAYNKMNLYWDIDLNLWVYEAR